MKTLIELFEKSVSQYPNTPLLLEKKDGKFQASTYKEIQQEVYQFAAGLMALGVEKGDRIAILSEGRNQLLIAELGIFYAGACSVPLSIKLDPQPDLSFRLEHSETSYIILSASQAPKLKEIRSSLPDLKGIIFMDAESEKQQEDYYWDEILEKGNQILQKEKTSFDKRWQSVQPEDLANISYTSGTTADPKGIMLSQLNYAANVIQSNTLMSIDENYRTFTILPWDHAFAHTTCLYCFLYNGASIASLEIFPKTSMKLNRI
jgi:long-chain acyl-CoA synthetase